MMESASLITREVMAWVAASVFLALKEYGRTSLGSASCNNSINCGMAWNKGEKEKSSGKKAGFSII